MINIATINFMLSEDGIVNTFIGGNDTIVDADLVIIDPDRIAYDWEGQLNEFRSGEKYMDSPHSNFHRNNLASVRNEIQILLQNGKVIVVFLEPISVFKGELMANGRYDEITNYDFLPLNLEFIIKNLKSGKGSKSITTKLSNPNHNFASFFKAFKNDIEYKSYFDIGDAINNKNCFILNRGNKAISHTIEHKEGIIVFLPSIELKSGNEKKLVSVLVEGSKKFLTKKYITPEPNWINNFKLKNEDELETKIEKIQYEIDTLTNSKKEVERQREDITDFKKLLYETGKELENIVINSFRMLGFKAGNRITDDLEHDIIFSSKEGKGIGEIEARDNNSIHAYKFNQLISKVDEDYDLTDIYPKGILIGNHFRFKNPEERGETFTKKVKTSAKMKSFGLIATVELYKAVEYLLENPKDNSFKMKCRNEILNTIGEIKLI